MHAMWSVIIQIEQIAYVHQDIKWIIMGLIYMVKNINKPTTFIATAVGKTGTITLHYWVRISGMASGSILQVTVCIYISIFYFSAISLPLKITTSYVSESKHVLSSHIVYHLVLRFVHITILNIRTGNRMSSYLYVSVNSVLGCPSRYEGVQSRGDVQIKLTWATDRNK